MIKKPQPINIIIPLHIYPFDIMVSINEDYDKFAKAVIKKWGKKILDNFKKQETLLTPGAGITALFTSESQRACMIKIDGFANTAQCRGTLTHEIFHVAEFVLRTCGLKVSKNSHEAYAYLIGYITEKIYEKI